jgi:AraC-like DNA-binding protein
MSLSYGFYEVETDEKFRLLFLPYGNQMEYSLEKDTVLLVCKLTDELQLFDCFHSEGNANWMDARKEVTPETISRKLQVNPLIDVYMKGLFASMNLGIRSEDFLSLKIQELFVLLKNAYTKTELASFFYLSHYPNSIFSSFIIKNHDRFNTVAELADHMNYTVSGFEKKFKKVFGVSPARWLREQKARRIYREVRSGRHNFKEIADKYNFSSTSTFNDFYKFTFGETPGATRRKVERGVF